MHRFAHFLRRGYASQRDHHRLRIFGCGGFNRFDVVVIERRNPLQLIILKQSELFRLEPLHGFSAAVGHLRVDQHEVGGRADHALARPLLCRHRFGRGRLLAGVNRLRVLGERSRREQSDHDDSEEPLC